MDIVYSVLVLVLWCFCRIDINGGFVGCSRYVVLSFLIVVILIFVCIFGFFRFKSWLSCYG